MAAQFPNCQIQLEQDPGWVIAVFAAVLLGGLTSILSLVVSTLLAGIK